VAGPILHGGNLSPNLQTRFCKLYPADLSVAIYFCLVFTRRSDPFQFCETRGARVRALPR